SNRLYNDEALERGLQVVERLTATPSDLQLRQFGRYFINYGLTRHLCAYLLSQTTCARDLVLTMRQAHIQMAVGPDGLTPPVFTYRSVSEDNNHLLITYESPRHFCGWLWGAIEGSADRFGERVIIHERTCSRKGGAHCLFEVQFDPAAVRQTRTPEQEARWQAQQQLIMLIYNTLPEQQPGLTMFEIQAQLKKANIDARQLRPALLLEALQMLQHAGLLASTANQPGDTLERRHYWRVPVIASKNNIPG
ncbi:MAG: heme NO-binding domain-containing protein, partial [Ktedonobacteraceae bacterium]|nr:heme NO-binding domain-containing protein [Ktedonobacteraceae bacterium]